MRANGRVTVKVRVSVDIGCGRRATPFLLFTRPRNPARGGGTVGMEVHTYQP